MLGTWRSSFRRDSDMKRNNTNSYRIVGILEIIVGLILLMNGIFFVPTTRNPRILFIIIGLLIFILGIAFICTYYFKKRKEI
jgi:uncharacterized membrane protein